MDSSSYIPPSQRSLSDSDLQEALGRVRSDYEGTLEAMAFLEEQAKLRAEDNAQFSTWVEKMQQNGTPQALWALENAMRQRSGLPPLPAPNFNQIENDLPDTSGVLLPSSDREAPQVLGSARVEVETEVDTAPTDLPSYDLQISPEPVSADSVLQSVAEPVPDPVPAPSLAAEVITVDSEPRVNRRSQAISQFWAWLGLSGSVLPFGMGALLGQFDVSFLQGVLAVALASLASASVISIGSLAGKRSGLATVFLSRAAFGVGANAAPAIVLVLARVFWSSVLLWSLFVMSESVGSSVSQTITFNGLGLVAPAAVLIIATALAFYGGQVLFKAQQIAGTVGVVVGLLLISVTTSGIAWNDLLLESNRSWVATFASATLIFSIFGLAWSGTGADFARKLSVNQLGLKVVGLAFISLAIIPTLFGSFGLALARGMRSFGPDFLGAYEANFVSALADYGYPWLAGVLGVSALLSLAVILAMSQYSTNLGLHALGLKLRPIVAQPVLALLVGLIAGLVVYTVRTDVAWQLVADYAVFFAVPMAAWSGIFASDVLIRRIAYHEISLSRTYGFYKSVNVLNVSGWFVATVIGLGLVDASSPGLTWLGYLAPSLTNPDYWLSTNFGGLVALAIGVLVPLATGILRIKRQEAEVLAIEARRTELLDVLGILE
ncbi:purine-cytosine permease family protein [Rhodoluna limnophila]|uniref:purine-cytosine permease family protein n=1 Tax=Rhodoluna limnophila TaxID=232537 RepID=UPI001106D9A3|nr:cytosine permease [Rhodoluna limnophila]